MHTDSVDIFWGNERSIPQRNELASRWFFLKAQAGNLSPGATLPFGLVSAQPYTGGYPTGSTPYEVNTKGIPEERDGTRNIKGFSHIHQSGTGAIKNYYNYILVTPGEPIELAADAGVPLRRQSGRPGLYEAELDNGVCAGLTVADHAACHRYTLTSSVDRTSVDFAHNGLLTWQPERPGTVEFSITGSAVSGTVTYEKLKLFFFLEASGVGAWQRIADDRACWKPDGAGSGSKAIDRNVELRIGFSLETPEHAKQYVANLRNLRFDAIARAAGQTWEDELAKVEAEGETSDIFYSALYNSFKKPVDLCEDTDAPDHLHSYADFATLWDQYKTLLPLHSLLVPTRYAGMMNSLLDAHDTTGAFPGGLFVESNGAKAYSNQAKALPHVGLAQGFFAGVSGIDYLRAVEAMYGDLERSDNLDAIIRPEASDRMTHLLDLSEGIAHARRIATAEKSDSIDRLPGSDDLWKAAYDRSTGLLRERNGEAECRYYEGINWNYSFRLLHQIKERIELIGTDRFIEQLDHFFGYDREPVRQPIDPSKSTDYSEKYHSFEGLNNEPDMETPYNYHFAGRTDRTFEIIDTIMRCQFQRGPNGVPGNDDSGGLSSWYVWNSIGLFPVSGHNVLLIGTPALESATIHTGNEFTVLRSNGGDGKPYVAKALFNGKPLERLYVTYDEVREGGELLLTMSADPNDSISGRPPDLSVR